MVLVQLGGSMLGALQQMRNTTKIDEKVLNDCLKNITRALFDSGADVKLLSDFKTNIKNKVKLDDLAAAEIIQQAVYDELCKMLDPGKPCFTPEKGKTSVVIFVGHSNQGSGITTTIAQYANYHKKKGYEPALVCADTFRDDAYDKLKRKANLAKIPFHGRNKESNGVRIAVEGVEKFKETNCDLIIVETSVRQMQMRHVCEATKADLVVCVMDGSIGEAAFDVALAFKQSVAVGAMILTNIDGHAKGGGTLTGVAAAKCRVIFIGTGALMDEFEVFDVEPFVGRLLGMDDLDQIQQVDQPNISLRQEKGKA